MYVVTFVATDAEHAISPGPRCRGDLALVRTLEGLVPDADVRLTALQNVRDRGDAAIEHLVLTEQQAAIFGLAEPGQPDASDAVTGPTDAAQARPPRDLADDVARFLNTAPGRCICHTCLASFVGAEFEETRKAIYALRVTGYAQVGTARCAACRQHRLTIAGRTDPPPTPG